MVCYKPVRLCARGFDGRLRRGVRAGHWKLILAPGSGGWTKGEGNGEVQLYNLSEDLGEKNNIAGQHPEKLQELDQIRLDWDAQLTEPTFIGLMMKKQKQKPKQ